MRTFALIGIEPMTNIFIVDLKDKKKDRLDVDLSSSVAGIGLEPMTFGL